MMQRSGSGHRSNRDHLFPTALGEIRGDCRHIPEGCRRQKELAAGHFQEGDLPGPPTIGFTVVMKLIKASKTEPAVSPSGQGRNCEHFGSADQNRGIRVDRGITGGEAYLIGT